MPTKKETTAKTTKAATTKKVVKKITPAKVNDQKELVKKLWQQVEKKSSMFQTVVIVILIILTAMSLLNYTKVNQMDTFTAIEKMEAMKVGGEDNYSMLKKILNHPQQKQQYKDQFETFLEQLGDADVDAPTEVTAPTEAQPAQPEQPTANNGADSANTLTADKVSAITAGYTYGDENATIAIIEYSDIECPFCKRHHDQGTIKQTVENFGGEVKYLFKHFPLSFHANAQKGGEALECLGEQLGADKFYTYLEDVYKGSDTSLTTLTNLATNMGADKTTFEACVSEGRFAQKVKDQMTEGSSMFSVNGTPGNIILNTETGKWKLISWAYPYSEFEKTVKELLE